MRTRSEKTNHKIILAARQLFLERGYAAASMEAIASTAGVTKQTLYGYFSDKRTLFLSVIEDVMGDSLELDLSHRILRSADDLHAILYRIGVYINTVIADPDYIQLLRVVVAETITEPGLGKLFERGVTARALRSLTSFFVAAKKSGLITVEHPAIAAQFFMGGFVTRIFLQGLLMQSGKRFIRKQTKSELLRYIDEFMAYAGRPSSVDPSGQA